MVSGDRLIEIAGRIRAMGVAVLLISALVGMPESAFADGANCTDYHIEFCIESCEADEGAPCGEQISGCAGQGTIECRETTWCAPEEEGEQSSFCIFDGGSGGN